MSKNLVIVEIASKGENLKKIFRQGLRYPRLHTVTCAIWCPKRARSIPSTISPWNIKSFKKCGPCRWNWCSPEKSRCLISRNRDPDREGEAIAWHVREIKDQKKILLKNPFIALPFMNHKSRGTGRSFLASRLVNDLVNAQQARRALELSRRFNHLSTFMEKNSSWYCLQGGYKVQHWEWLSSAN